MDVRLVSASALGGTAGSIVGAKAIEITAFVAGLGIVAVAAAVCASPIVASVLLYDKWMEPSDKNQK